MEKKSKPKTTKQDDAIKDPWLTWQVLFPPVVSVEQLPAECSDIEKFLDNNLSGLAGVKTNKGNFSFEYRWSKEGRKRRSFILDIFIRSVGKKAIPPKPDRSLDIVKKDKQYVIDEDIKKQPDSEPVNNGNMKMMSLKMRSSKNTVKLTPPRI